MAKRGHRRRSCQRQAAEAQRQRRRRRHLVFEHLEDRQLLSAVGWEGEACPIGDGGPSPHPHVVSVDAPASIVTSLGVTFDQCMNTQSAIDDGSIVNAVSLVDLVDGPVPLAADQFSYDGGTQTLSLAFDKPLPTATYELQLNGSLLTDAQGNPLRGGSGGLVFQLPSFAAAEMVQAAGTDIHAGSYTVPSLVDWNSDGRLDLIVGEKLATGEGKVRVYLNSGSDAAPAYDAFFYAPSSGADLAVSGSGCMGVFPRVFDWNQDGLKDLVLGLADGAVHVALNENTNENPNFAAPEPVQVGEAGSKTDIDVGKRATLDVVDWNDDGRYDLVLGDLAGNVRVLLNEADSGPADFRSETMILDAAGGQGVPTGRASVAVADLNGDGRKDLVVGNTEGQLLFYANVGNDAEPEFAGFEAIRADGTVVDLDGQPRSRLFVGDANGDGRSDLLVGAKDGLVRLYVASTEPTVADGPNNNDGEPGDTYTHTFRVAPPWQCPTHKYDVDGDKRITVLDVLALVDFLTANGPQKLPVPPAPPDGPPPFLDCDGDGNATALDVLQIVTDLNTFGPRAVGEAEGEGFWAVLVENPSVAGGEGESTQMSSPANANTNPTLQPQRQPKSPPQPTDREEHGEMLSERTTVELLGDDGELDDVLSEIASGLF